jgi:hypothetical protein
LQFDKDVFRICDLIPGKFATVGVTQAEERLRNCISADKLLISSSHPLAPSVIALYNRYAYMRGQCQVEAIEEIDPIARYS